MTLTPLLSLRSYPGSGLWNYKQRLKAPRQMPTQAGMPDGPTSGGIETIVIVWVVDAMFDKLVQQYREVTVDFWVRLITLVSGVPFRRRFDVESFSSLRPLMSTMFANVLVAELFFFNGHWLIRLCQEKRHQGSRPHRGGV